MLIYLVIAPVFMALLQYLFPNSKWGKPLCLIVQGALLAFSVYLFTITRDTYIYTNIGNYHGFLGIYLRADSLSTVFLMLAALLFLLASIYCYREKKDRLFWCLMFIWQGTLMGLLLTRDFFNIFVMIEVITMLITILIMFERSKRSIYEGMIYLMTNVVASQFYLFGVGYLYRLTGRLDMEAVAQVLHTIEPSALVLPYALIMTGIAFKCALVPLFSWLPMAHGTPGAPSAVSAILSGLQIKGGVYLFIRVHSIFFEISSGEVFLIIGIITGFVGVFMAICQTDIKLILAYHTISQVGLIFIGLSAGNEYSLLGGMYHVIAHGAFKSVLFLTAGIIIKSYGTRDVYKIGGVLKRMPLVGVVTIAAVLGITGAPFFIGSISKYFISYDVSWQLNWIVIVLSLGTIISFTKYSTMLFGHSDLRGPAPEVDNWKLAPSLVLGALCLIGGVLGQQLINYLFHTSVRVDPLGYAQKSLIFFASAAVGLLIYKYIVKGNTALKRIGRLNFGFRDICVSMGVFFAALLVAVGVL